MGNMENNYFLVKWIEETPVRCSVMSSTDIVDSAFRMSKAASLLGKEIEFRWKKKMICMGLVMAYGSKAEMEEKLHSSKQTKPSVKPMQKRNAQSTTMHSKKQKIDAIIDQLPDQEQDSMNDLKLELANAIKRSDNFEAENNKLKEEINELKKEVENNNRLVDIGNGVMLGREYLNTIKAASPSLNVFARSLFKKLFEPHEVIGYSLMGKHCNALNHEVKPSVDSRRRDAIIEYSLKEFGRQPGGQSYSIFMKDVKKSLACLISEITKESKSAEEQVLAMDMQNLD